MTGQLRPSLQLRPRQIPRVLRPPPKNQLRHPRRVCTASAPFPDQIPKIQPTTKATFRPQGTSLQSPAPLPATASHLTRTTHHMYSMGAHGTTRPSSRATSTANPKMEGESLLCHARQSASAWRSPQVAHIMRSTRIAGAALNRSTPKVTPAVA